ncbi:major facilitator superfamily transporter [Nitzschia inconspicua]|uniref:Major facilitator superfamily transporter n=1 Tax=Nitzschia inconspicua TaxID=303405 RepID=A0A9K3LHF7_9STRA|nr:major facilitator superfamily transporter [Nitzschia inconspicua]
MGAANNALAYSYIATVLPLDQQTSFYVLLSMARIVGMILGPFVNLFLGKIDASIEIGHSISLPLNPKNSVGLFVASGQLLVLIIVLLFFKEPQAKKEEKINSNASNQDVRPGDNEFWKSMSSLEIAVPLFIIFVANCNFLLIETVFPPACAHGLGWGPVQTSSVMGSNALIMLILMMFVMFLFMKKVSDTLSVMFGNIFGIVGGLLVYYLWTYQAPVWHFVLPYILSITGFPFIVSSNRSNFTKAVKSKPELANVQSTMQAIMSMTASMGGFVAPSFVAMFVMRSPEDVETSRNHRELSPAAWSIPLSSAACLFGLWFECLVSREKDGQETVCARPSERTSLLTKRKTKVVESV